MSEEITKNSYVPRLRKYYNTTVKEKLIAGGNYKNVMQVPKLEKITLSCSLTESIQNSKVLDSMVSEMSDIAGQKAKITRSKKAISNFKLREDMKLGCAVTLRNDKMYEFFDRFIHIACPRIRDFKGFTSKSFDGRGNFSLGIKEHTVFPEVNYDKIDKVRGFNITFGTTATSDADALELLKAFDFPFRK